MAQIGGPLTDEERELWGRIIAERPTQKEKHMVFMFDERLRDAFPDEFERNAAYVMYATVLDGISNRCNEIGDRTQFDMDSRRLSLVHPRLREFLDVYVAEYWISNLCSPFSATFKGSNMIAGEKITRFVNENKTSNAFPSKHIKVGIPQRNIQDFQNNAEFYQDMPAGTDEDLNEFRIEAPSNDQNREILIHRVGSDMYGLSVEIFLEGIAALATLRYSVPALIRRCRNVLYLELRWCRNVNWIDADPVQFFAFEMPKLPNLKRLKITADGRCPLESFNYRRYFNQLRQLEISFCQRNRTLDQAGLFPNLNVLILTSVGFIQFQPLRESVQQVINGLDSPKLQEFVLDGLAFEGEKNVENAYIAPIIQTGMQVFNARQPNAVWNYLITYDAQADDCKLVFKLE